MEGFGIILIVVGAALVLHHSGVVFEQKGYNFYLGFCLGLVLGPLALLIGWLIPSAEHDGPVRDRELASREWIVRMRERSLEKRLRALEEQSRR